MGSRREAPLRDELTKAMGVSRITVREAIQKLVAINLVETHQGKGSFVKNVNSNSYLKAHDSDAYDG